MRVWFLLFIPVVVLQAQSLRTFGIGLSSQWLYPNETEIFNYTLTSRGSWGVLTHFWATGDPAIDLSTFSYYIDGENVPSIQFVSYMSAGAGFNDQTAPWGTTWMGKGAKGGAWYNNFRVPFQKSIRVTGRLPAGITDRRMIWTIVRGTENLPTIFHGFQLPSTARLTLHKIENKTFDPFAWVRLVDIPTGQGLLFSHTLAVASGNLEFLEGCYHAYPDYQQAFPGVIIATGTEDYFDSAYYFNGGQFRFEVSGFTHFRQVSNNSLEWSAYRMHDLDPIFFDNGFRFEWRNGDVVDERGFKCIVYETGNPIGSPTQSVVTAYAWVYTW
ncbi:unnamed protein product [Adineta steineri]|uniref:DUF5077 domain-containing protein n=1 Tax=Adineta steineri TaxID=433720 RepID=A0A814A8L3_9BILA|nr:unnamed protein product [Adineta steineri]CAF1513204.1 unnamed protein product [Adineta steineri]CAF3997382.1 unnamed protein product [Adineta steineri]CAF4057337.1 unnamed protein product [Adineta steineri]